MKKYMKPLDWIIVGFIASIWGLVALWLLWPYNPIEVHSIVVLNTGKTVEQGGTLAYRIKWTKHTDKQGIVRRYFVNGHKHSLDGVGGLVASAPPGPGEAVIFITIPYDNPIGVGRMQWTVTYPMNPMRNVVAPKEPVYSDKFTVTERAAKGLKGEKGDRGPRGERGLKG